MKRLLVLCLLLSSCFPKHNNPLIHTVSTKEEAFVQAENRAAVISGRVFVVADTHSMEPTLWGGDYVVVVKQEFSKANLTGKVITYHASWRPAGSDPVTHRVTGWDSSGALCEGDNVDADHPENKYRVTASQYVGTDVEVFRPKK